jgi:catechol 2,3-dioxygenase-like lactoylglutathione lyase family enzyme
MDMKLEVVVVPVSDVDRAKDFYQALGWRLDADFVTAPDFRVIQMTPPGSACDGNSWFVQEVTTRLPGRRRPRSQPTTPRPGWPVRCAARRPRTANTRRRPGSPTRTGPAGMPSTRRTSPPGR